MKHRYILGAVCFLIASVLGQDEKHKGVGTVIGIDLGTSSSCVAVYRNGRVEIIPNEHGMRIIPSYVSFTPDGQRLVGEAAKKQLGTNPENTVFDVKRLIGREWSDASVQHDIKYFPFKVKEKNNKPSIEVKTFQGTKEFAPEEISAMVIWKLKQMAKSYLGKKVTHAVITVPAYFNDAQRQATKDAATISGLEVMRIINEPTAAAIAYGLVKKKKEMTVVVFDLGGGTFDVSLLKIKNGTFEVIAINGNTRLGGEDFNQRVMDYFIQLYMNKRGKDIRNDNRAVQKLMTEVEKAKRALSSVHQVHIEIENFYDGEDLSETLTRAKFEELNLDLFLSTLKPVQQVLEDANMKVNDIDEIVLVGGSTHIPKVQKLVRELFSGKEPSRIVNTDEAVAFGAAVQAGILSGEDVTDHIMLIDVNPLTLGIEILGGVMMPLIPRNSIIPIRKSQLFSTVRNNQDVVTIKVFEGERTMTKDNHLLGTFDLVGIPPALRGVPKIKVSFFIDRNGILEVAALDIGTGRRETMVINSDQKRLTMEEIERMVHVAEIFSADDEKIKDRVEARNELEYALHSFIIKIFDDEKLGKIIDEDKTTIKKAISETRKWLKNNKHAELKDIKKQKKAFENVTGPIIQKIFKSSVGTGSSPPSPYLNYTIKHEL